jgi:hypothetical protein
MTDYKTLISRARKVEPWRDKWYLITELTNALEALTAAPAQPATVTYSDGTQATGKPPLPALSPWQQETIREALEVVEFAWEICKGESVYELNGLAFNVLPKLRKLAQSPAQIDAVEAVLRAKNGGA